MRALVLTALAVALAGTGCKEPLPPIDRLATWRAVPLPLEPGETGVRVERVRGLAANDIWVVGAAVRHGEEFGVAFHYDGTAWTRTPITGRATMSVFPISHDDVWAVGRYGTIAHWNGKEWIGEKIEGVDYDLLDVAGRDGDLYAASTGSVLRYDGHRWRDFMEGVVIDRLGVLPNGAVAITGEPRPRPQPRRGGFVAARDGELEPTIIPGAGPIRVVAASSAANVWAVGWDQRVHHFDGTSWTAFAPNVNILDVAIVSPTRAYFVGGRGLVMRWENIPTLLRIEFPSSMNIRTLYAPPGASPYVGGNDGLYQLVE